MFVKPYLLCCLLFLCGATSVSAKAWRGIEPLHSTRAEVERLLGPPNFDSSPYSAGYDFPEERVFISYADGVCEEEVPGGWKVPKDTVVGISAYLSTGKTLAEVLTPGKEYEQVRAAHTPTIYYIDRDEGVSFTVSNGGVQSISYGPSAKDKDYMCAEYKYAAPIPPGVKLRGVEMASFDAFGNIRFDDAKARLDNFVIQLFNLKAEDTSWRGYIVVYAGRRSYLGEAQFKADCYKNYLVRVRKMDAASLIAVDGGFRAGFQVELFYGRADEYPPMLFPTVSPKKVEVMKRRLRSCK